MSILSGMFNFWRQRDGHFDAVSIRDRNLEEIFRAEGALHRRINDRSYRFCLVPCGPDIGSGRNESDRAVQICEHDH